MRERHHDGDKSWPSRLGATAAGLLLAVPAPASIPTWVDRSAPLAAEPALSERQASQLGRMELEHRLPALGTGPVTTTHRRSGLRVQWRPKAMFRLHEDGRRTAIALPVAVPASREGNAVTYVGIYPGLVCRYVSQPSSLDLQVAFDPSAVGSEEVLGDAVAITWTLDIDESGLLVGGLSEGGGDLGILDASGQPALLLVEPLVLARSAMPSPEAALAAWYVTAVVDGELEISLVLHGPGLSSSSARDLPLIFAATVALSSQPVTE